MAMSRFQKSRLLALTLCWLCGASAVGKSFTGFALDEQMVVGRVMPDTPAQRANIMPGDRIESVNGVATSGKKHQQVIDMITGPAGTRVTLVINRGGKRYQCALVRALSETAINEAAAKEQRRSGVYTGLQIDDGNRVASVDEHSRAWIAGIRAGDRIEFINNVDVRQASTDDVSSEVVNPNGGALFLRVARAETRFNVILSGGPKPTEAKVQPVDARNVTVPITPAREIKTIVPIEIFRRSQFTESIERQVRQALAKVPARIQEAIKQAGIAVLIVPDVLTAQPHLNVEKPRGYHHGGGYDNCGGLFYSRDKKVYICERLSYNNSPLRENWYVGSTALHEMGHAYDHTGGFSKSDGFIKAYEDDGKYLGSEQRKKFEYFLQENDDGRSEMFAELFLANASPKEDASASDLSKAFPRCTRYVGELIGKIQ